MMEFNNRDRVGRELLVQLKIINLCCSCLNLFKMPRAPNKEKVKHDRGRFIFGHCKDVGGFL